MRIDDLFLCKIYGNSKIDFQKKVGIVGLFIIVLAVD